jgi:hypothetical protein
MNCSHQFLLILKELPMQQRSKALLLAASLLLLSSYDASASSYASRLGGKLGNGIANVSTGFIEIPKTYAPPTAPKAQLMLQPQAL